MVSLCLKLGPVYSRLALPEDLVGLNTSRLPANIQLRRHQAQTWQAYNDPEIDVIFDTALTGDGKSLAGQLPMLSEAQTAMLLYPTNALIDDQSKQIKQNFKNFGLPELYATMYGERITELMQERDIERRGLIVRQLLNSNDCLLSNPDLFHLMSSYNYGYGGDRKEYPYLLPVTFNYFVFDEFHIFEPPQIISVLNVLNYHKIARPRQRPRYVFLSATPTALFKRLLHNGGFRVREIEGEYSPIAAPGFTDQPIVQPVSLNLHKLTEKGAYAWAEAHLAELVAFYQANPGSKGVFIVNSVAMAKRLVAYYKETLEKDHQIIVGENTGLTNRTAANLAMQDDSPVQLIIATSTIDVGVDFRINLLIFESSGAGTFIQRLGRLGRHAGWGTYQAHALLPDWIVDKFEARFPAASDGTLIERTEFLKAVRGSDRLTTGPDTAADQGLIFQPDQEYRNYTARWGGLQTAHMLVEAEKTGKHPRNGQFLQELKAQYNRLYGGSDQKDCISRWLGRYWAMSKDEQGKVILAELNNFRGSSPLSCGILDETDGYLKTYDLFFLLANTRFQPISEARFREEAERRGEKFEKYASRKLGLYVRLEAYLEERQSFVLTLRQSLKGKLNQVGVFGNFNIGESRVLATHENNRVNEQLSELDLVGLLGEGTPKEFKRKKHLGPMFQVYQVKGKDGPNRSLVLGLPALLAHSQIPYLQLADHGDDDECLIF